MGKQIRNPLRYLGNPRLTIGGLIDGLADYPVDMTVAILSSNYGKTVKQVVTKLSKNFIEGEFWMDKETVVNLNYFQEEEIPDKQIDRYEKVLIISSIATPEEVLESGLHAQRPAEYKAVRPANYQSPDEFIGEIIRDLGEGEETNGEH